MFKDIWPCLPSISDEPLTRIACPWLSRDAISRLRVVNQIHLFMTPLTDTDRARPPGCDVTEGPFWDDARLSEIILAAWVEIPSVHCTPLKWKLFREERVLYKASVTIGERDTAGVKENTFHFLRASVCPCWLGREKRASKSGRGGYGNSQWDFWL